MKPRRGKTPRKRNPNNQSSENVEVFCRIRPIEHPDIPVCIKVLGDKVVQLCANENSNAALRNGQIKEYQCTFEHVFDECISQKAIYDYVSLPLVEDLIRGKNGLLFTYGITSSGKTYTMTGTPQDQGILPRCLDVLFNSIGGLQAKKYVFNPDKMNGFEVQSEADAMMERQKRDILPGITTPRTPRTPRNGDRCDFSDQGRICDPTKVEDVDEDYNYAVFVSYIEIYNNYVYDLLEELPYDPITGYRPPQTKMLRTDSADNMYVMNCVEVEIKSPEEAFEILYKGQKRRKVAHTALNAESSRSHSIFNIRLVQAPLDPRGEEVLQDQDKVFVSQLSLVDLAGSERTQRTKNAGDRLKEAGSINQSLMTLRTCIEILRENQKNDSGKMVPYRDSKLTHLFKNYFDGDGKVRMIVCVNPKAEEYDETVHVMKFAEMTQEVLVRQTQQVKFDLGLTPGRRRLNQQYKEAVARAQEIGETPVPAIIYSMGPGFPALQFLHSGDNQTLANLESYLGERFNRRSTLLTDLSRKQDQFRSQLVEFEREYSNLRLKNEELQALVDRRDMNSSKLESKVRMLEKKCDDLQRQLRESEKERRDLNSRIQDRDLKLRMEKTDKERLKDDFKARLDMNKHHWEQKMGAYRHDIENKMGGQIWEKQQKLNLLKSIVNEGTPDNEVTFKTPSASTKTRTYTTPGMIQSARSESDVSTIGSASSTPRSRTQTTIPSARSMQHLNNRGAPTPTPRSNRPVYNPRHRRSKSSSNAEVWLDHQPVGNLALETVMQPVMKKKKSVSKLDVKSTKEVSKYCLTHQEQGSDGEFQTKLIKGDVIPTAGGGSAVVFNDVETLKQTSPGSRKRRSSCPEPEDYNGEWIDTETRCNIGIEGHGRKRTKPMGERESRV